MTTTDPRHGWICCQLGAREHYAVPRALHRDGRLARLFTDAWAGPGHLASALPGAVSARLSQRFHPDLAGAPLQAFTGSLVAHEVCWKIAGRRDWDLVIARNEWFQSRVVSAWNDHSMPAGPAMVFAHSYAAATIFREAKSRGWTTVLGQIDPGPEHYAIQERLAKAHPAYGPAPVPPPPEYLSRWREECGLADHIVVNSDWSREALARAAIPESKLHVAALPYEAEAASASWLRTYPDRFSVERPMRALFVGTAAVAKGVAAALEAIESLADLPIELHLVGDETMVVPDRFRGQRAIVWHGAVTRRAVMDHYRQCDVLLFPSFSDGFGMAQIEAQAWHLPIVASRFCGRVVRDGETGLLLPDVSAEAIAAALRSLVANPNRLAVFAANAAVTGASSLKSLAAALLSLEPA